MYERMRWFYEKVYFPYILKQSISGLVQKSFTACRGKKKHPKTLRESEECMCLCVSGGFGHGLVLVYCLSLLPRVEDRPELTERNL